MKLKALFVSLLCAASIQAQVTLEHTYPGPDAISVVNLSISGYKYAQAGPGYVKLYNPSHSLWKTLVAPAPSGFPAGTISYISEGLFDTDNGIEFMATFLKITTTPSVSYSTMVKVFEEDATEIASIGQCAAAQVVKVGTDWKLIAPIDSAGKYYKRDRWEVYSLVGNLPPGTNVGLKEGNVTSLGDPSPNPSSDRVVIPYALPEGVTSGEIAIYDIQGNEVKRLTVDATFNTLELDNRDLPSGTYFCQMQAGQVKQAKRLIVIK